MACLMAEALDVAAENFIKMTKYEKLTALSKTLRDDASCQLCSILLKVWSLVSVYVITKLTFLNQ